MEKAFSEHIPSAPSHVLSARYLSGGPATQRDRGDASRRPTEAARKTLQTPQPQAGKGRYLLPEPAPRMTGLAALRSWRRGSPTEESLQGLPGPRSARLPLPSRLAFCCGQEAYYCLTAD